LKPGTVLHDPQFYVDKLTGELKGKYLAVLAPTRGGDVVLRLLTSKPHGRPEVPPCYHGLPYPGFYLGMLGPPLGRQSWLDLRALEDADSQTLQAKLKTGAITVEHQLPSALLSAVLDCVAAADDTTSAQESALRDQRATLA
jgi:hypothetical protein